MIFRKKDEQVSEKESALVGPKKGKVKTCDVSGCSEPSVRTVSGEKARKGGLAVSEGLRKVHLCKKHYKEYKKATKKDRELERMGW